MSGIDGFTAFSILVRALGYAGGLLAVGSGLFLVVFGGRPLASSDPAAVRRTLRQTAFIGWIAAAIAVVATAIGVGVRAGRLSGLDALGMADETMLQIVWEGPVGTAATIRLVGLAAVVSGLFFFRSAIGRKLLVVVGGVLFAYSHAFVGHATEDPQWLLSVVITVHLIAAAFWIGAFAPLAMIARRGALDDAASLLDAFGRTAVWVVAVLVAAGATFAVVLLQTPSGLIGSAYGRILMVKLVLVALLLALAAVNKFRLVPALASGDNAVRTSLVASIRLEAIIAALILLATAVLTSIATPPASGVAALPT